MKARVGLISDTHGLLRPAAKDFLHGSDFIIHAGDIGDARILSDLAAIAAVTAVRGNNDKGPWAGSVPLKAILRVGNVAVYVLHNLAELVLDPGAEGFQVVVSGHSHRPSVEQRDGVLYVNPGSAGPRRFNLPISVGELKISGDVVKATLRALEP